MPEGHTMKGARMRRNTWNWLLPSLGVVVVATACSSDEKSGDDSSGNTGGTVTLIDPNDPNDPNNLGYEGGARELTPEQADALKNPEEACTGWGAEPEGGPSTLMMVIDTSQSMANNAPNDRRSKWSITAEALVAAINALPASAWVGLMFYPNMPPYNGPAGVDITECVDPSSLVPVGPLGGSDSDQRRNLVSSINAAGPGGCTPTHGAYVYGLAEGLRAVANAPGDKHMLLITDGQPTLDIGCGTPTGAMCSPADPTDKVAIQDEIAAAYATGVRTWVIGSPGSEENETTHEDVRGWLSVAAEMGGTALLGCSHDGEPYCHFDMSVEPDFSAGLEQALLSITGQIVGCQYDIPPAPAGQVVDRDQVNLVVTNGGGQSYLILRDSDPNCDEGWYYDGDQVMLCAKTCSDVENDPGASLSLTFGCNSNEIPEIF